MSLDAGSIYTTLGGRFAPGGFTQFDAANKQSARVAEETEAKIAAAQGRVAASSARVAAANDAVSKSGARLRESLPLAAMGQWDKSSQQAAKNLGRLGSLATKGAAVGILALGAATVYAATKATTFNREMLKISTQAGASTTEVKSMSKAILEMAGTVPQGPQKLAEGLYHIESAGFRGAQALGMLKFAAEGAALGNANLEATTQSMIATMASHIKGVHGSADAMGQLNAIVGVGDMRMEQLAQAMATGILPSAHDAGLSLRDVGAALATVTDNATPANVTATRLRMTIALMAAPSKAAVKQLESIGLTSISLAHDMRQPNGLLKAVEDLKTHLQNSGKTAEEQDAVLSHVFGGGKSSAVIHTLISELDRLRAKYHELEAINGPTRLAKSWSEFQASNAATFSELKSGAEAFAITVGDVVLPSLAKLAHEGSHALSGFVSSGGAAATGASLTHVFETLGQVVSNLAPPLLAVAGGLVAIGKAAGLGNAAELSGLIAAFVAFKSATFIAPILTAIAAGISEIGVAAVTAGSLAAFGGDLVALAGGPVGAIVIGLSLAAGAFVALESGMFSSTSAAERNAAAMQKDEEAIKSLHDATDGAAKAHFTTERAVIAHQRAVENLKKVEAEIAHGTLKGTAAHNALREAHLLSSESADQVTQARSAAIGELEKETTAAEKATAATTARHGATLQEIADKKREIVEGKEDQPTKRADMQKELNALQAKYNEQAKEQAQALAEIAVSEESRRRIDAGRDAISPKNAQGVQALQNSLFEAGASKKIVTRYELDDQGAQAKLGQLAGELSQLGQQQIVAKILTTAPTAAVAIEAFKAVLHGVPSSKVVAILHNAPNAKAAMGALSGAIHAVPGSKHVAISSNAAAVRGEIDSIQTAINGLYGKTIAVAVTKTFTAVENIVKKATGHASGRGAGAREASIVGEGQGPEYVVDANTGKGTRVDRPTLMGLGPSDYVIPLEDRYRGRALGLFAMLARDLEIPGYKKGRAGKGKAKHHAMPVPNAIPPLSLPLSDIEQKESTAKSKYDKAASKVTSLESRVRDAERALRYASAKGTAKAKDRAHLAELQKELRAAKGSHDYTVEHKKMREWARTLREAKRFQAEINDRTLEANNAGNAMKLAAGHGDVAGYDSAKNSRLSALGALQTLIRQAQKQVKTGSEYALQLEGQLQNAQLEAGATEAEQATNPAAEREEQSGMTADEEKRLEHIEANVALAALTTDLGDDKTAAGELVSFLQGVLGKVQAEPGPRGGDETIKNVAGLLKTAQNNVESLSGQGTNENADLQAQITQANERAEVAKREAQTANQALAVFGGSGDIGAGGAYARGAAAGARNITINTLHPGDPATLLAIGNAAAGGLGLQGGRQSPRVRMGP